MAAATTCSAAARNRREGQTSIAKYMDAEPYYGARPPRMICAPLTTRTPGVYVNRSVIRAARIFLVAVIAASTVTPLAAQQRGAPVPDPFRFQMMGPAEGGRIASITGVPGD